MSELIKQQAKEFIQNHLYELAVEYKTCDIAIIGPQNPEAPTITELMNLLTPYYGGEAHIIARRMLFREFCQYVCENF